MTGSRLATLRRVYELFNSLPRDPIARRESPATKELVELFDPDVEFIQPATRPDRAELLKGREEVRASWNRWLGTWEHHRAYPQEMHESGDRVLVLARDHYRGREGVELEQKGAAIYTFSGPKIVRFEAFLDHETARREFER